MAQTLEVFINKTLETKGRISKHDLVVSYFRSEKKKKPTLTDYDRYDSYIKRSIEKLQSNGMPVRVSGEYIVLLGRDSISSKLFSKRSHDFAKSIGNAILNKYGFQIKTNQKKSHDGGIDFVGTKEEKTISSAIPSVKIVIVGQVKQYNKSKKRASVEEIRQFQGAIDANYSSHIYEEICSCDYLIKLFVAPEGFTPEALKAAIDLKIYPLTALDLQSNILQQ